MKAMINEIEEKLKVLNKQEEDISINMQGKNLREKRELEIEKGAVHEKIMELEVKKTEIQNKQAENKINILLTQNRQSIFFSVNMEKMQIPENLQIKLTFQPCGHTKEIPLREVLRAYEYREDHNIPRSNTTLLELWKRVFEQGDVFEPTFSCEQCRKEQDDLLTKMHIRRGNAIIGHCRVIIRKLQ